MGNINQVPFPLKSTVATMNPQDSDAQQKLKAFLQRAVPIFQRAKTALSSRDWLTLSRLSHELQKVASESAQVMIEVQAQLLEQAANQSELHRSSYLLLRIKNGLAQVLAEVKSGGGFTSSTPAKNSSVSSVVKTATDDSNLEHGKRLGNYLVEAELLTPAQIEVALADQKATGARLGEILSMRGWIKQGTIEFLMKKVILPDRKTPQPSGLEPNPNSIKSAVQAAEDINSKATFVDASISAVQAAEDVNSKATFVDSSKSTYIY